MIKHRFVLDEATRSFLDLTARSKWTDVRLNVGGTSLGPPLSRAQLRDGQSYALPDGSELFIQLEMPFLLPTLRLERDGLVVPGSDASPEKLSERAGGWLIGLGGLNFLLGLGSSSLSIGPMRNALFLVGVFFALCGFFARRGSLPALVLGTGLFFLGALRGLPEANLATVVVQIAILTPMFRALYAHYLERTSSARPRRDAAPMAVAKSVIRPRTEFAETIAPLSRPQTAGPNPAGAAAVGPGGPETTGATPPPASVPITVAPGAETWEQRIGPYVLTGTLGSGGMATVYQARQTSVGRDIALKVITGNHNADPEFGERFRREAETTARLSHPHILKVFDFGEDAGRPYLAMEYMSGGTLRRRVGATPLPVPQVLKWAEQIGPAIQSAHSQGVVHRDIKPENVLLDQSGNAFLADFGLARLSDAAANLTQAGTQMGSPSYMAPEQWHGADVNEAADLYAFAALLYELLTGRPPFRAATLPALMAQHLKAPVPSARAIRPSLPPAVDAFFAKALNKAPDLRFADAVVMVEGLRQALRGATMAQTSGNRASLPSRVGGPIRRPTPAGSWQDLVRSPAGIAVAVLVGLVGLEALRRRSLTTPRLNNAREEAPSTSRRQRPPTPRPVATAAIAPATLAGNLHHLPFRLTDAAFSRALNRLVVIAEGDKAVMIVDPETGNSTKVNLSARPRSVTMSPEGFAALVTSDFSVSLVNLASGTVDHTVNVNVNVNVGSIALLGSWAYILRENDQLSTINLISGETKTGTTRLYTGSIMKAHPSGRRLYTIDRGMSPVDLYRIDAVGPALAVKDSPYYGDHPICEDFWFAEKGDFAFTGCGNAFSLSDDPRTDMDFAGTVPISNEQRISAFTHSDSAGRVLVVPASSYRQDDEPRDTLVTYEFPGFRLVARDVLPRLGTPQSPVIAAGRFVFANRDGRRVYVVLEPSAAAARVTSAILAADIK